MLMNLWKLSDCVTALIFWFCLFVPFLRAQNSLPATGEIGVGTTAPAASVDILTAGGGPLLRLAGNSTSGYGYIQFGRSATAAQNWHLGSEGDGTFHLWNGVWGAGVHHTSFSSNGFVGIGTYNPSTMLDIASAAPANNPWITLENTSGANSGSFGPGLLLNNHVPGTHGYILEQRQASTSHFAIADPLSPYTEYFTIDQNGRVGIGTSVSDVTLDVVNATADASVRVMGNRNGQTSANCIIFGDENDENRYFMNTRGTADRVSAPWAFNYHYLNQGADAWKWIMSVNPSTLNGGSYDLVLHDSDLIVNAAGNVGIGTGAPTEKLSVNGAVRAKEVIVETNWSDYVFDDNYRLAPLSEVEAHIKAQKHLDGVPSAKEVSERGIRVGDIEAKLLAKIEELTLHQIEQEKRITAQQAELSALKQRNAALEARVGIPSLEVH